MSTEHSIVGWLTKPYDYQSPRRGQIRKGKILRLEEGGAIVDVGLKRDGFVPWRDIERLRSEAVTQLEVGQEVITRIVRPRDRDGNLILSLYQARMEKDWTKAQEFLESGQVWEGQVSDSNRGGLLVRFGHIRGFVPASHLWGLDSRHLPPDQRQAKLQAYVRQELLLKVIEVDRDRRRLILSERLARRQLRRQTMERLLDKLLEGQVVRGTVTRLVNFGAFVDLGGADGLIHVSELAWRRVRHAKEVVQVGDEVDVYILRLDHQRKRISLSLKRLQPSPWDLIDETYTQGQLVSGLVTNVVEFGAFVLLDIGVEGLVHVSELAAPLPSDPCRVVQQGDELVLRILRVDSFRHRLSLSLKRVSPQQRGEWLAQGERGQTGETDEASDASSEGQDAPSALGYATEEATHAVSERSVEEDPLDVSSPAVARLPDDEGLWNSLLEEAETALPGRSG
jgi:small subunit ribosomal protein S1